MTDHITETDLDPVEGHVLSGKELLAMAAKGRVDHVKTLEHVPIGNLSEYPGNARIGDVDAIADSMDENGVFAPIIVQRSTGYVLDGNHRLKAMDQLGMTEVPVVYVDVDDERAKRIVLVANRTNDLATYDDAALVALLQDLPDLTGTGYDDMDLTGLIESLHPAAVVEGVDEVPGGTEYTVTVICADADDQTRVFDELDAEGYKLRATRTSA